MTYKEWREIVDTHYGSLDIFSDATTVRHWFHRSERAALDLIDISEQVRIRCGEGAYLQFKEAFTEQMRDHMNAAKETYDWLEERNLKP